MPLLKAPFSKAEFSSLSRELPYADTLDSVCAGPARWAGTLAPPSTALRMMEARSFATRGTGTLASRRCEF